MCIHFRRQFSFTNIFWRFIREIDIVIDENNLWLLICQETVCRNHKIFRQWMEGTYIFGFITLLFIICLAIQRQQFTKYCHAFIYKTNIYQPFAMSKQHVILEKTTLLNLAYPIKNCHLDCLCRGMQ